MTDVLERSPAAAVNAGADSASGPRSRRGALAPRKFRPDIEGLRAVAVISVVLYHAGLGVRGGYVGVDVFFVISGFLITGQLLGSVGLAGLRALPGFYARRIKRLLPASVTVVVAVLVAARIWAGPLQVRSIATDGIFTSFYGLNYRLALEGTQYLHQDDAVSPLQHFWSLGVEEQFYLGWPVLILMACWLTRARAIARFRTPVLAVALTALVAISYRWSIEMTARSAPWAYFSLQTRAWELALGALVAVTASWLTRLPRAVAELGGLAGLAAVLGSCFVLSDATAYPGALAAVPVGGAALVIAAGCSGPRRIERILGESLMQCIGRISYSWYLWHWPMLIMIPVIAGHQLSWQARVVVVWASVLVSVVSYFAIEDPARHLQLPNVRWLGVGALLSAAVVCAGLVVIANPPRLVGTGADATIVTADSATPAVITDMRAAVAAGVAITLAPRNLTPSPASAANNRPAADSTNCHADFATVNQGACVYGDPNGGHTAVLLGDSHADMWLPAFDEAGKHDGWRIIDWTKSSCPAANLTVFNSSLNRTYTECDTWRANVVARIAALKPELVIVSGSENVVGAKVTAAQWSAATLDTMKAVHTSSGARVILLQDVPVPAYQLPACVAAHLSRVSACTFAISNGYSFPTRHRELAADAQRAGYQVIDPAPWICTSTRCPAIVGNLLVYRDDTHLTAAFSQWLWPDVVTILRPGR